MEKVRVWFALVQGVALALACGCASGDDDEPAAVDARVEPGELSYAPCSDAARVGRFFVRSVEEDGTSLAPRSEVGGEVTDGVHPMRVWEEVAAEGDCRLVVGPDHFCDPACPVEQTCAEGGSCVPVPRKRSIGTATVHGLAAEIAMSPSATNFYQVTTELPHPLFAEGAAIHFQAEGGDYAGFELRGRGVAALELSTAEISVARAQPIAVEWAAPAQEGASRVRVELDIAHHGGVAARIECEAEDDGSLTIPGALVTQLVDRGTAGFPTIVVERRTADSVELEPGCVEFTVQSVAQREVAVEGVVSCSASRPCPDGQTCRADLTCS